MGPTTAPATEGLEERSITVYGSAELSRAGVRGAAGGLGMQAKVRAFGAVLVIGAHGTGSDFERRPVRADLPTIDIIFVQRGTFAYFKDGTWIESAGPLMIAPSGLPTRVRFTSAWEFVVARLPREALLPFVPALQDDVRIHARLTLPERAMEAFLRSVVAGDDSISTRESNAVDHLILEMAGTILRARQGSGTHPDSPPVIIRDRALAVIAQSGGDPGLKPAQVAAVSGVSLRRLQVIFAEAGTSIADEIRRERARLARSALQDPRMDLLDMRRIAAHTGFGSVASMRRALVEIYGLTPSELRRARARHMPEDRARLN